MTASGVVALSGNPRAGSRTLVLARTVADELAGRLGLPSPATALDLAEIAGELFAQSAPDADRYRNVLAGADVAVVATPVYKASYTGLLKAFLDRYPAGGLRGVLAVPVVVSASPAHSFVAEHLLRPLLVELGASVPTRPLAVTENQLAESAAVVSAWADDAAPVLGQLRPARLVGADR
jgi:FMN reductase